MPGMKVRVLPALQDNYMYLIVDEATNEAAIVDPVEPETVLKAVAEEGVTLTKVLTTHYHWDHAGGNKKLVAQIPALTVFGGSDRVDALTSLVKDGDKFRIGSLDVHCLHTPCHTTEHICYLVQSSTPEQSSAVFTGDTLFIAGCGRFFEGTPDQMYTALVEKLGSLPNDTKVFCGHEYTVANLQFARHVEPNNMVAIDKLKWAQQMRADHQPTVPSTIKEEKATNPFMRVTETDLQKRCGTQDPVTTMGFIRKEKDSFKA